MIMLVLRHCKQLSRLSVTAIRRCTTNGEPVVKCPEKSKKIGTHDGVLHCDDVFACYMLKQLPQYKDAEIVRTRDQELLDKCDVVVDVGGVYDPQNNRYDHHQRDFKETGSSVVSGKSWPIRLSSAGLVYCHFGREILRQLVPTTLKDNELEAIFDYVYDHFVQEIDALDNGVSMCDEEPRYRICTNLSVRVSYFNPRWNADIQVVHDNVNMENFKKAMNLVGTEFEEVVKFTAEAWWPARSIVADAIKSRYEIHPSGQIMKLKQFCPWKEHYFDLMKEAGEDPESINFCIYSDSINNKWRVQAVPRDALSFVGKIFLHPEWRGLRDEELLKLSGIDGSFFVHATGFVGGNLTAEGAVQMAVKSIEFSQLKFKYC